MHRQGLSAVSLACSLLALAGCRTEHVSGNYVIPSDQPGPDKGGVVVAFSPPEDTYTAVQQAPALTQYHLFLDGKVVAESDANWLFTIFAGGNPSWVYYVGAGPHHFAIQAPGQAPVFQGDGQVPGAGTAHLFLYGPLDAVKGIFAATPSVPSAGNEHITVLNLMRSGRTIEVVSCSDATTCTPISPALALGDLFDTEVPAVFDDCDPASGSSIPGSWSGGGCFTSRTTTGAGIGYRFVPTASLPNPPVSALTLAIGDAVASNSPPPVFVAAPVFMNEQGLPVFVFD
jgi:hypothetical protein